MADKQYLYSEIFKSIQGEGHHTGKLTMWLRFFLCNLQCDGFGQKDPTDPSTYNLPYQDIDLSDVKSMTDLPVFKYGCDSSYSWSKKFKHLQDRGTVAEIAERIRSHLVTDYNTRGEWRNFHMCFTGGEPLMKHAQECSVALMRHWIEQGDYPRSVTYETNGTQKLRPEFVDAWNEFQHEYGIELFFSISPKLFNVSGENAKRAIQPQFVADYFKLSSVGQLKYVANGSDVAWEEIEIVTRKFRDAGCKYPVWIMPIGARVEEQVEGAGDIANEAIERGYHVAARVHTYLFGNAIGT